MAIAFVKHLGSYVHDDISGTPNPALINVAGSVSIGNFIIVWGFTVNPVTSITDTQGNTYNIRLDGSAANGIFLADARITNAISGTNISVTRTSNGHVTMVAAEFSGLVSASWFHAATAATFAATTAATGGSQANSSPNGLVLGLFKIDSSTTIQIATPGSGFTNMTGQVGVTGESSPTPAVDWEYKIATVPNPVTATATLSASTTGSGLTAIYRDVAPVGVPPLNTLAPVITGTAKADRILSCNTGTWSGDPTIIYTYAWKRNNVGISGATSSSYLLVADDVGQSIKCTVTASNSTGTDFADSNTVIPTPPDSFVVTAGGLSERASLSEYKFELANSIDLSRIGELTQARGRSLQLALNRAGACNFQLPLEDEIAEAVEEVSTCVLISRDSEIVWSGPVWTTAARVGADAATLDVGCVGWLQMLDKRYVRPTWAGPVTYNNDAGAIALALLERSNEDATAIGAPNFIFPGTYESTQIRIRTYATWNVILTSINELSEIESGFDMLVDPSTRKLNIYSRYGTERGTIFQLPGSISSLNVNTDSSRISNYVTAYSATALASDADADSIADLGFLEEAISLSDVTNPGILGAYAAGEVFVKHRPLPIVTFKPIAESVELPDNPRWIRDFDIGDTIRLTARKGRINFDRQLLRIFTFTVNFPDTGGAEISDFQTSVA